MAQLPTFSLPLFSLIVQRGVEVVASEGPFRQRKIDNKIKWNSKGVGN